MYESANTAVTRHYTSGTEAGGIWMLWDGVVANVAEVKSVCWCAVL